MSTVESSALGSSDVLSPTNGYTTQESTAEPITPGSPKEQNSQAPPNKKQKPNKLNEITALMRAAQWYTHFGNPEFGTREDKSNAPGIDLHFGLESKRSTRGSRSKTYQEETYELRRLDNLKREAAKKKREIELKEQRRIELQEERRLKKEREAQRKIELKKKAKEKEIRLKIQKENKKMKSEESKKSVLKRAFGSPGSLPSASPEQAEPEPEEFVDGYKPFSYTMETDVEIPIRDDFFIPEVYAETVDQLVDLKFTSAYEMVTGKNSRFYKEIKDFKPRKVKFKNVLFPNIEEEYIAMATSSDLQLDSFEEMGKLMELLALNYFSQEEGLKIYNPLAPYSSLVGKYSRALHKKNYKLAISKINEFNATVTRLQSTNEFIKHLKSKKTISRVFIHEILNEIYSRSVSPNINLLKKYAAFSSNVYGELLPKFLSQVFDQVGLNSKSKFLDLGSGVGNVTIQAALEYGCESYGCEVMQNCSELGDLQLTEFEQRCKIFGLNPGVCKFFHRQSFLDNPEVKSVIDQCDVILCNNFLFTPDLKEKTLKLFNNLKPGTKIISLKTILPDSHHIEFDDVENFINKFEVCKYEFETNSVSWTHKGGVFYITEFTGLISERALSVFNTRARERKLVIHKRLSD